MWPFSDMSLSTATWWYDAANLVLLGSLLFGVLSTFAIVRLANVKEHHWDIARDQSRERVAGLETELGQAHAAIADANARALEAKAAGKYKAPRRLDDSSKQRITSKIAAFREVATGGEPSEFLVDIDNALENAGWTRPTNWPNCDDGRFSMECRIKYDIRDRHPLARTVHR